MKRILSFFIIGLVGFVFATVGRNYFLYWQVNRFCSKYQYDLQIQQAHWGWEGVSLEGIQLFQNKPVKIQQIQIFHKWLSPLHLHFKAYQVESDKGKILSAQWSLHRKESLISSDDLVLRDAVVVLERRGSSDIHRAELAIPELHSSFQFHQEQKDLSLALAVPAFGNEDIRMVSLQGKGNINLQTYTEGRVDLHVIGMSKMISMLINHQIIKKKKAHFFLLGAHLLGGQNDESDIPLVFDKGSVFLGPFPIHSGILGF